MDNLYPYPYWARVVPQSTPKPSIYSSAGESLNRITEDGSFRILEETPQIEVQNSNAEENSENNEIICDRTGFRVKVSEGLVREWTGKMVRRKSWEPRHPQEFIRSRPEHSRGSPRPQQPDQFVNDAYPNGVGLGDLDPS